MGKLWLHPTVGALKAPINTAKVELDANPILAPIEESEPNTAVIEVIKEVVVEKIVEKPVLVEKVEYKTEQVPVYIEVPKEIIKEVIKEVVVEKLVEVPVEVIKEVHKTVTIEVPVEKIIIKQVMPKWSKALLVIETLLLIGMVIKQIL